jgi:hypothetical protein
MAQLTIFCVGGRRVGGHLHFIAFVKHLQDGKGDADLSCDAGHEQFLADDARSLDARRELVRQNLVEFGHERTLNPVFHARCQHRRKSRRLRDPGELQRILLDEVMSWECVQTIVPLW